MAPTEPARDALRDALAADLTEVLGTPVAPTDLADRRDGAAAGVVGLLACAAPLRRSTACRLLTEWAVAGTVDRAGGDTLVGPDPLDVPTLRSGEQVVLRGLRLEPPAAGTDRATLLHDLASTAARLLGGVRTVVAVEPGRTEQVPGWVARLRLLAKQDDAARVAGDDLNGWVIRIHEAVASNYVPDADPQSVWTRLLNSVQAGARAALVEAGELADVDLYGRSALGKELDRARSASLPGPSGGGPGTIVQLVRLPRTRNGRLQPGAALLSAGDGA